jgi:hypothetical protein
VHKRVAVPPEDSIFHCAYGYGWSWLGWSFAVLAQSPKPKMVVISEPMASSDDEETMDGTRFGFAIWHQFANVYRHPFVQNYAPELYLEIEHWVYSYWVNAFYDVRRGRMPASFFEGFAFGGRPPFRLRALLKDRMLFLKWVASRLNVTVVYKLAESNVFHWVGRMLLLPVRKTLGTF